MDLTRRQLITGTGALVGATAAGLVGEAEPSQAATSSGGTAPLPKPSDSGIEHVVVVMMENRSFDHYLGWLPGARGTQAGLTYVDGNGIPRRTYHLSDYQGCAHPDPDHSFEGGRVEYNGGACDGWLRAGQNDEYAIGYYTASDLAFYRRAAKDWTVCDSYFSAIMAETYPNRFYQHSAQTDRIHNSTDIATMPTIWDRLAAAGVKGTYYFYDTPFLALWGSKYVDISKPYATFLADAAAGTLPAVSFVDPKFLDEETGTSADDHPHADIRAGQYFLDQIYEAVSQGSGWERTVLVINYDEWGGFFDHIPPTTAPDAHPEWGLRGFRVPCLVISPLARRGYVARDVYDHTSVLAMIEWRWGLPPLTPRDAAARNLAEVLDFASGPDLTASAYNVPAFTGAPCAAGGIADYEDWHQLTNLARSNGWTVP